jgi:hypothetical protein
MNDWKKIGKWLVTALAVACLVVWTRSKWDSVSSESSSAIRLSYTLCDGLGGPPGVKDFDSLPKAESDPSLCFPATMVISARGSDEVRVNLSYDNSRAKKNASYGRLEAVSYDGVVFVAVFTANNDWAKPPTKRKTTVNLTYDKATRIFRGVEENYHQPGRYSQVVLFPR